MQRLSRHWWQAKGGKKKGDEEVCKRSSMKKKKDRATHGHISVFLVSALRPSLLPSRPCRRWCVSSFFPIPPTLAPVAAQHHRRSQPAHAHGTCHTLPPSSHHTNSRPQTAADNLKGAGKNDARLEETQHTREFRGVTAAGVGPNRTFLSTNRSLKAERDVGRQRWPRRSFQRSRGREIPTACCFPKKHPVNTAHLMQ